jgi:hypothetical protein
MLPKCMRMVLVVAVVMGTAPLIHSAETQNTTRDATSPVVVPPAKGPMPENRVSPINPKQGEMAEDHAAFRDKEIQRIQGRLKRRTLSAGERKELERKLGELTAEKLVNPPAPTPPKP